MSDDRKPLPETGFRCYPAKPESITCNMTILIDQMITWLQAEKAKGEEKVKLTMLPTQKPDAKVSHFFAYDDFKPEKQGGNQQSRSNVTPMQPSIPESDIPFSCGVA